MKYVNACKTKLGLFSILPVLNKLMLLLVGGMGLADQGLYTTFPLKWKTTEVHVRYFSNF